MELDMKKDIKSKDIISEGTLHEILLDIKYRLDHLEDMEADNRSLMIKLIKQSNSVVKFLAQIDLEPMEESDSMELPPISNSPSIESGKIKSLKVLLQEFMDKQEELQEFEKELKKHKDMLTPGQAGDA